MRQRTVTRSKGQSALDGDQLANGGVEVLEGVTLRLGVDVDEEDVAPSGGSHGLGDPEPSVHAGDLVDRGAHGALQGGVGHLLAHPLLGRFGGRVLRVGGRSRRVPARVGLAGCGQSDHGDVAFRLRRISLPCRQDRGTLSRVCAPVGHRADPGAFGADPSPDQGPDPGAKRAVRATTRQPSLWPRTSR